MKRQKHIRAYYQKQLRVLVFAQNLVHREYHIAVGVTVDLHGADLVIFARKRAAAKLCPVGVKCQVLTNLVNRPLIGNHEHLVKF